MVGLRYRKLGFVAGAILGGTFLVLSPAVAAAQATEPCELHIWPTDTYSAHFLGAMPLGSALNIHRDWREEERQQLEEIADEAFQVESMEAVLRASPERYSGYRIVIHPALAEPYWRVDREGSGDRLATSSSHCYAELHVNSIGYERTALEKDVHVLFLFRQFGESRTAVRWYLGGDGTGVPAFPARSAEDRDRARADVRAAFEENLRNFLGTRRVRRMERELAAPQGAHP